MKEHKGIVGNYAVAGTERFLLHALKQNTPDWITFCGLHLKYHTGQQWEETEEEKPSCLKCKRAMEAK